MDFWNSNTDTVGPLKGTSYGRIETEVLNDAVVDELVSLTNNGMKTGALVATKDVSLSMPALVKFAEMILGGSIRSTEIYDNIVKRQNDWPEEKQYRPEREHETVHDAFGLNDISHRAQEVRSKGLIDDGSTDANKTGQLNFKMPIAQAAKAVVFSSYLSQKTCYSGRDFEDHKIGGITSREDRSGHMEFPVPMDIAPPKMGVSELYFRLKVQPDYSRESIHERTGIAVREMKRESDNFGNHYILIPESAIDRVLGISQSQKQTAAIST